MINFDYARLAAEKCCRLLEIDSPTGFTDRAAEWVEREFAKLGYRTEKTVKGGVLVDLGGEGQGVLLEAHTDTLGAMVAEIKASGKGLYLLSNFNKRLRGELHLAPSLLLFDGLVISGEVGLVKPDVAIYKYLLDTYGLKAEECLFVDDRPDNIEAGEKAGIKGYLFDGDAEKLRGYLKTKGII